MLLKMFERVSVWEILGFIGRGEGRREPRPGRRELGAPGARPPRAAGLPERPLDLDPARWGEGAALHPGGAFVFSGFPLKHCARKRIPSFGQGTGVHKWQWMSLFI